MSWKPVTPRVGITHTTERMAHLSLRGARK